MEFRPNKLYYKIREVCEIVGLEAHVLRFWETEFPSLAPPKSKNGQRTYRARDIELILEIRKLLYEDGYTIAGARKYMRISSAATAKSRTPGKSMKAGTDAENFEASSKSGVCDNATDSERLKRVQKELENILTLLDRE